jgi:hypothetical protein
MAEGINASNAEEAKMLSVKGVNESSAEGANMPNAESANVRHRGIGANILDIGSSVCYISYKRSYCTIKYYKRHKYKTM